MQLSIMEAAFIRGREKVAGGHLIWPDECPPLFTMNLELNQGYRGNCVVTDQGRVVFSGQALVKRRQSNGRDQLVVILPEVDVGRLSPNATVEMNPCKLEFE